MINLETVRTNVKEKAATVKQKVIALSHWVRGFISSLTPWGSANLDPKSIELEVESKATILPGNKTYELDQGMTTGPYADIDTPKSM